MSTITSPDSINLICIPYAGGSKYSFKGLYPFLKDGTDMITLELPGRGARVMEPLLTDIEEMVDDLYRHIQPYLSDNYILYGHSMGGTLGNLLLHKLNQDQQKLPLLLLVTGCAAPKYKKYEVILHKLNDVELLQELKILGGLPESILANDELMDFFLPILRADIQALETNVYQDNGQYAVPLTVIVGTDESIDDEQLYGWKHETSAAFTPLRYEGNHFFILDHFAAIAEVIHGQPVLPA